MASEVPKHLEQRAYCKARALLGYAPTEIKADLNRVYGPSALSYPTVLRWVRRLQDGRQTLADDPRSGRPASAITKNEIDTVKQIIETDARYTVNDISSFTGINSSAVFEILKHRLMLKKVCARWVPHILTDEQKRVRVEICRQLLEKYEHCDFRRLNEIVTGDETWIFFFEPEIKRNNKVWVTDVKDRPQIARHGRTVRKVMYAIFFDSKGPVVQIPVPESTSVTAKFYKEKVLTKVVSHYKETRPRTGTRGIHLLHDNAPAHKASIVTEYMTEMSIKTLPHLPYSPDLSPCDFWLNPLIKDALRGRRFESRQAVGSALYQCLKGIPKSAYKSAFQKWIQRLKKCIKVKGEYFEGL
ncbi:histone-lysine N-methyltransferase SETMAR-like [Saccostrea cucullata]|uniref:histone-lysine N-methyltransferase SETMAR-like n=1 Tax=Saccostrea cuccullata TaxID=36930 RepID=UPI002ED32682